MDALANDDMFLGAVGHGALDAMTAIGDDPPARFAFFRRLLAVVIEVTGSEPPTDCVPVSPARTF